MLGVSVDQVDFLRVHVVDLFLAHVICHGLVVGLVDVALLSDGRRVQKALEREGGVISRRGGRKEGASQSFTASSDVRRASGVGRSARGGSRSFAQGMPQGWLFKWIQNTYTTPLGTSQSRDTDASRQGSSPGERSAQGKPRELPSGQGAAPLALPAAGKRHHTIPRIASPPGPFPNEKPARSYPNATPAFFPRVSEYLRQALRASAPTRSPDPQACFLEGSPPE